MLYLLFVYLRQSHSLEYSPCTLHAEGYVFKFQARQTKVVKTDSNSSTSKREITGVNVTGSQKRSYNKCPLSSTCVTLRSFVKIILYSKMIFQKSCFFSVALIFSLFPYVITIFCQNYVLSEIVCHTKKRPTGLNSHLIIRYFSFMTC